jgi:hypothetical protein
MNVRLLESDCGKENFRIRIAKKIGWFRRWGLCRVWESERALHTAIETHTEPGIIREGMFKFQNYNGINNLSGPVQVGGAPPSAGASRVAPAWAALLKQVFERSTIRVAIGRKIENA